MVHVNKSFSLSTTHFEIFSAKRYNKTTLFEGEALSIGYAQRNGASTPSLRDGKPVCLFDSEKREGETDLLFPAEHAQPGTMRQLRQDCGGLCS